MEEEYHVIMVIWNGEGGKGIDYLLFSNRVF